MNKDGSGFWAMASRLDTSLSIAGRFWQAFTVLSIGGGGLFTGFLAKADPVLKELGPIYWVAVGVVTSLFIALALNVIRSATLKKELANYYASLTLKKSSVNPLLDSFQDLIIAIEDLRLPGEQVHTNKTFRRCKFVGPAALGVQGGTFDNITLNNQGHLIALENGTRLAGVVCLIGCIIQDCEFFNITILADKKTAQAFRDKGLEVSGLSDV